MKTISLIELNIRAKFDLANTLLSDLGKDIKSLPLYDGSCCNNDSHTVVTGPYAEYSSTGPITDEDGKPAPGIATMYNTDTDSYFGTTFYYVECGDCGNMYYVDEIV